MLDLTFLLIFYDNFMMSLFLLPVGRTYTDPDTHDLGASWIHGSTATNPITALAKTCASTLSASTNFDNEYVRDANGDDISDAALTQSETDMDALTAFVEKGMDAANEVSLQDQINTFLATTGAGYSAARKALLTFQTEDAWGTEYASSFNKLSSWYFDSGKNLEGAGTTEPIFINGYVTLVSCLAKPIPVNNIKLNTEVTAINYNSANGIVEVKAKSGATYTSKRVVVTVPLGVLKAGTIAFSPPLPATKLSAISKLGVGVLNKIYMEWDSATFPFKADGKSYDLYYFTGTPYIEWLNFNKYMPTKYAVVCFTYGDAAIDIEKKTDGEIKTAVMTLIKNAYAGAVEPKKFKVTRWSSNPFYRGSYSNYAKGSAPSDRTNLQATVGNYLYFAGEATDKDYLATTMGAYNSGLKAANSIVAAFGKITAPTSGAPPTPGAGCSNPTDYLNAKKTGCTKGVNCNGVQDCSGKCFTAHVTRAYSTDKICDNGSRGLNLLCAYFKNDANACSLVTKDLDRPLETMSESPVLDATGTDSGTTDSTTDGNNATAGDSDPASNKDDSNFTLLASVGAAAGAIVVMGGIVLYVRCKRTSNQTRV
jgi:monoamine oxidase